MIALFGGSFDPVHYGHIHNADLVYKLCSVKKMIILPCGIPAHKSSLLFNNEQRLELLKIGFKDYPHLDISNFEFNNKTNYTIDTLRYFAKTYGIISFIMGSDSFIDLPNWDEFKEFNSLTNIIVINRNDKINNFYNFKQTNNLLDLTNKLGFVYLINNDFIDISSTTIREAIENNKKLDGYMPAEVIKKINEYSK